MEIMPSNDKFDSTLVITLAGSFLPQIYLIFLIFFLSYNYLSTIITIINYFLLVILN